jgi:hypothetical protein
VIVLFFVFFRGSIEQGDIIDIIIIVLIWGFLFLFQSDRSRIGIDENCLKIKWMNWVREKVVPDNEIEKIILGRQYVSIYRKDKKPIKLILESLEKEDKTKIYEFLIEYSKQRNLALERQFNS